MNPKLFILSGPSGVGKNTLLKAILKNHPDFYKPINYTTRGPRSREVEGVDYYFNRSRDEFKSLFDEGELLEYVEFAGELYGTSRSQLEEAMQVGKNICTVMEVDGGLKVKEAYTENTELIFILPPDIEVLKDHLKARQTETEDERRQRMQRVDYEIDVGRNKYDHQVVNPEGRPEQAVAAIEGIIERSLQR